MGDRCYSTCICLRQAVPLFEEMGYLEQRDHGMFVELVEEEANYGNHEELMALDQLPEKPVFIVTNGSGSEYSAHIIACDGEALFSVDTNNSGCPVVEVPRPMDAFGVHVPNHVLEAVEEFWAAIGRIETVLGTKY